MGSCGLSPLPQQSASAMRWALRGQNSKPGEAACPRGAERFGQSPVPAQQVPLQRKAGNPRGDPAARA